MSNYKARMEDMVCIDAVAMFRNIIFREDIPISELATRTSEKELLRQLIERGFIERYQVSPKRMRLRVTDEGKELHMHMEWMVAVLDLGDEVDRACMRNNQIYLTRSGGRSSRAEEDLKAILKVIGSRISEEVALVETPELDVRPDYMDALIEGDLKGLIEDDFKRPFPADDKDTGDEVVRDTVTAEDLAKGPQQPPAGMLARDIVEDPITNEPLSVVEYHKKYGAFPTDDVRIIKRTGEYRGGRSPSPKISLLEYQFFNITS